MLAITVAVAAALAFAIALILKVAGHGTADLTADFTLAGLILLALSQAAGWYPWRRPRP